MINVSNDTQFPKTISDIKPGDWFIDEDHDVAWMTHQSNEEGSKLCIVFADGIDTPYLIDYDDDAPVTRLNQGPEITVTVK